MVGSALIDMLVVQGEEIVEGKMFVSESTTNVLIAVI